MNYDELIRLLEDDMIPSSDKTLVNELMKNVYLRKHPFKIYQGKDGAWYTYLPDDTKKNGRRLVRRVKKEALEDLIIKFYSGTKHPNSIKKVFDEWNQYQLDRGKIKEATFTRNEQTFRRHFSEIEADDITILTSEELTDFMELQISKHHLTSKSFSNLKYITRGFLRRAKRKHLISFDVESTLSELDISDKEFRRSNRVDSQEIFFDEEMNEVLKYCHVHMDDLPSLGVALMFISGMRVGEVVVLQPCDICDGVVSVTKTETRYRDEIGIVHEVSDYPKTPAGVRNVVIPDKYRWVLDQLTRMSSGREYIFVGKNGERLHTQAIRKRCYQICKKLNMPVRSPHKIRKTYGSILLDNHLDSKFIERQMGHTDIKCTENYYHKDRRHLDQKREIINAVTQFM